jgi:uncharacterized membrane protein YhiD involved in acid resistance
MENSVNFQDIIKKGFLNSDGIANTVTIGDIFFSLSATIILGMFVFYVYRNTFRGVLYTQTFNISLVMIAIVTNVVIITVSSNFILSLGMVGALSIVRFRTAIKDSMDIVFMFWAISIGIANGAGMFKISFISSLFIALTLFFLTRYKTNYTPYMLIINYENNSDNDIYEYIKKYMGKFNIKSKAIADGSSELMIEIRIKNNNTTHVDALSKLDKSITTTLISYNGDYVS